jgi:hypothetical protein
LPLALVFAAGLAANAGAAITAKTATIKRQAMSIARMRFTIFTSFSSYSLSLSYKTKPATLESIDPLCSRVHHWLRLPLIGAHI